MRYAIYDYDMKEFVGGTYDTEKEALDDLDPRLNNCTVITVDEMDLDQTIAEAAIRRIMALADFDCDNDGMQDLGQRLIDIERICKSLLQLDEEEEE